MYHTITKMDNPPPPPKKNKNKNKTSYFLPHAFMEDTIRHIIAQKTSTSKGYTPCLLVIIIK